VDPKKSNNPKKGQPHIQKTFEEIQKIQKIQSCRPHVACHPPPSQGYMSSTALDFLDFFDFLEGFLDMLLTFLWIV
jgi:hypothetical protein